MSSQERHINEFWESYKDEHLKKCVEEDIPKMQKENKYHIIAKEIASLVGEKQEAYGDSFGNSGAVLKILYPNGITTDQYGDVLTVIRIIDKLFRIANKKDAFGESPYRDIIGYGLLAVVRDED